jgi:hypothetical protein
MASLLPEKDEKSEYEISRECREWGNTMTWNSSNRSMGFIELCIFWSSNGILIRSVPFFPVMAMTDRVVIFRTISQSIDYLSCLLLANHQAGTSREC